MDKEFRLLLSCEHSSNKIPIDYLDLFKEHLPLLESHWAYDQGASDLAEKIAFVFSVPVFLGRQSRLLVDLNRSLTNPKLFSKFSISLKPSEKQLILEHYYYPYRRSLETVVREIIQLNYRVLHLSIHSFTPVFNHEVRQGDIGLLYDPKRQGERNLTTRWQKILKAIRPDLVVRKNYPYLGTSDGVTSSLRKAYEEDVYLGIELEVNQKHFFHTGANWDQLKLDLETSLQQLFHS